MSVESKSIGKGNHFIFKNLNSSVKTKYRRMHSEVKKRSSQIIKVIVFIQIISGKRVVSDPIFNNKGAAQM